MQIITTIVPIFIVILLGLGIQRRNFIPPEFLGPANRLVYYVAIPAMIFKSMSGSALLDWFNPKMIIITLASVMAAYIFAWGLSRTIGVPRSQAGSFIQCAGHGNLGYIGLAVAYYFLGDTGLVHASVVVGFVMILQNLLSATTLLAHAPKEIGERSLTAIAGKLLTNPVILSVLAGMAFSIFQWPVPLILKRSLEILSGLALPTALLLIGASLSFERIRGRWNLVLGATLIKLIGLPAMGWFLFGMLGIAGSDYLPALIQLAAPTATVTYVMAKEMQGDTDLATAVISTSTLLSAVTFSLWLKLAAG